MQNVEALTKLVPRWWPCRKKKFTNALVTDVHDLLDKHQDETKDHILKVLCRTHYFQNVLYDESLFDSDITNTHLDLILILAVHNNQIMNEILEKPTLFALLIERILSMTVLVNQGANYVLLGHIFHFLTVLATSKLYHESCRQLMKELVVTRSLPNSTEPLSLRSQWLLRVTTSLVEFMRDNDLKDVKSEVFQFLTEIVRFLIVLDCQLPLRQFIHDFVVENNVLDIWHGVAATGDGATELKDTVEMLRYSIHYPIDIVTGKHVIPEDNFEQLQVTLFNDFPQQTGPITDIPSKYDTDRESLAAQLTAALKNEQLQDIAHTLGLKSSEIDHISSTIANFVLPPSYSATQYLKGLSDPLPLRPHKNTLFPSAQYMTVADYINRSLRNGVASVLNEINRQLSQVFERLGNGFKGKSKYFLPVKLSKEGFDLGKASSIMMNPGSWVVVVCWGKLNKFSDDLWTSKFGVSSLRIGRISAIDKKIASIEFDDINSKVNEEKNVNFGIILLPLSLQASFQFYLRFENGVPENLGVPDFFHDTFLGYERNIEVVLYKNIEYKLNSIRLAGSSCDQNRPIKKRKVNDGIVGNICHTVVYGSGGERKLTEIDIPGVSEANIFDISLLESCVNPGVTVVHSSLSWDNVPQLLHTLHVNFMLNLPQERHLLVVPDKTPKFMQGVDIYQDVQGYDEWILLQLQNRISGLMADVRVSLPEHIPVNDIDLVLAAFDAYVEPRWDSWVAGKNTENYPFDNKIQSKLEARTHYMELVKAFEELEKLREIGTLSSEQLKRYLRDNYCRTVIVEESKLVELTDVDFDSVIVWGQSTDSFIVNYQLILTNRKLKRMILVDNNESSTTGMYLRLINMGVLPFSIESRSDHGPMGPNAGFSTGIGCVCEIDTTVSTTQYSIKEVQICAALYRYMISKGYLAEQVVVICSSPVHLQLIEQNYNDVKAIKYHSNLAQFEYVIWSSFGALEPEETAMAEVKSKAKRGFYIVSTGSGYGVSELELCPDESFGRVVGDGERSRERIDSIQQFIEQYL